MKYKRIMTKLLIISIASLRYIKLHKIVCRESYLINE